MAGIVYQFPPLKREGFEKKKKKKPVSKKGFLDVGVLFN